MEDLARFCGVKPFKNDQICTEIVLYGPLFQKISPAALLKPLKHYILLRSPPQAEILEFQDFRLDYIPPPPCFYMISNKGV